MTRNSLENRLRETRDYCYSRSVSSQYPEPWFSISNVCRDALKRIEYLEESVKQTRGLCIQVVEKQNV